MKDTQFLQAAVKLKRNTGNDLSTIGMQSNTPNMEILISGDADDDYEMQVDASYKYKKHWHKAHLSESNLKVLEIIFEKEVERVHEEHRLADEAENESEQYAKDVERYGRTDTIYDDNY